MSTTSRPRVQVVVLAYGHEGYIEQALDSILAQQTNFSVEIIVGEDCSTDHTRQLIVAYQQLYPTRFRLILQSVNVGMGANLRSCLALCDAPYIAALEGDDYWLDPLKLQKQVDWLEANPSYSMCFHRVRFLDVSSPASSPVISNSSSQRDFTFSDFLRRTVAHTGSAVLRNQTKSLPDWLFNVTPIDYPLFLLQVEHGPARLLPETMGVYRVHSGGIWSGAPYVRNMERYLAMYAQIQQHYTATKYQSLVAQHAGRVYLSIADELTSRGLLREAAGFLKQTVPFFSLFRPRILKSVLGVSGRWLAHKLKSSFGK